MLQNSSKNDYIINSNSTKMLFTMINLLFHKVVFRTQVLGLVEADSFFREPLIHLYSHNMDVPEIHHYVPCLPL